MNRWATMLGELPAELQRAIARAQRISLPRRHDAAERLRRLREALCHARTVRVVYAALDPHEQAALQDLRRIRGGITQDDLARRYGPVRPAAQLAADPHPQSLAERLALLGWLLPRPPAPGRARRFLLPPEVRAWLPQPLKLASPGPAPAPGLPPALRAAATLLYAAAERPLDACADGRLRRSSLRIVVRRLAPLPAPEAPHLARFVLPLLVDLGLLARRGPAWAITPVAARFLAQPQAAQQTSLQRAWLATPTPDAWLTPLVPNRASIDLPVLRRRLCQWAEGLPAGRLLAPAGLYDALAAAFGPLADAHTHGWRYRPITRAPWQPRRAAAVFDAALRGPLRWLGLVGWADEDRGSTIADGDANPDPPISEPRTLNASSLVFRPSITPPAERDDARAWGYGAPGQALVPHRAADADVLRLLPFARWQAADAERTSYEVTPTTLAAATSLGLSAGPLWALLERRAGPIPDAWRAGLEEPRAAVRIVHAAVALADPPAALDRVAEERSVRRRIAARLAPGVALVEPSDVAALTRALERRGVAAQPEGKPAGAPAGPLSPHESAALLLACAFYRRHAPPDAPLLPHDLLEERLRAELTPPLRAALDSALDAIDARLDAEAPPAAPAELPAPMPLAQIARCLGQAITRAQTVELSYDRGGQGEWSLRVVRPLALEWRYDELYLRAYCTLRQAERTFRVDRIGAARVAGRGRIRAPG